MTVPKGLLNIKTGLADEKGSLQCSTKNVHITTGEMLSFSIGPNLLNQIGQSNLIKTFILLTQEALYRLLLLQLE